MLSSRDRGIRHTEGSKMKIKDGDFKELVDTLFATQEGEFNHIYE